MCMWIHKILKTYITFKIQKHFSEPLNETENKNCVRPILLIIIFFGTEKYRVHLLHFIPFKFIIQYIYRF